MTTSPAGTSKVTESWSSLSVRLSALLTKAYGAPTIAGLDAEPGCSFLATARNHVRQVYIRRIARGLAENDATVLVELATDGNDHEVAKALFTELTQVSLDTDAVQQQQRILAWAGISDAWLEVAAAQRSLVNAINRIKAIGRIPEFYEEKARWLIATGCSRFIKGDDAGVRFDNPTTGITYPLDDYGTAEIALFNCHVDLSTAQRKLAHERFATSESGLQHRIETALAGRSAYFL